MAKKADERQALLAEVKELRIKLEEAEEGLHVISSGGADAVVVSGHLGAQVFMLKGEDHAYRVLVEAMNEGAATLAAEGTIVYCNSTLALLVKTPMEKLTGTSFRSLIAASSLTLFDTIFGRSLDSSGKGELVLVAGDGTSVPVYFSASTMRSNDTRTVCAVVTDLTKQKSNEAIVASGRLASAILEQAGEIILVCDEAGHIICASQMAQQILGTTCLQQHFDELLPLRKDTDGQPFSISDTLRGGIQHNVEVTLNRGDGRHSLFLLGSRPLRSTESGAISGAVSTLVDITERKQAEDVLKQNQQQQLQLRDQFLSRMSHELRSPMTPIHQFVTILLDGLAGDLNAEQREYLQIILRNVTQLRTMVSDLLDVTRAESGKLSLDLRCVYLTELMPQILKPFTLANTKDLRLSFDVIGNLPAICADPDRVRQIVDNLLDNAVKFTPEKGEINVRAQVSNRDSGFISVAVTDTGCGISSAEQEKIFDYLYQVKIGDTEPGHNGLGIGLYICKQLVCGHGGRIWVESQPGRGSTFFFTLPVFPLEGQLASIVKAASLVTHSIALITVEVSHPEKRPLSKSDRPALLDAWSAIQSCTLPNLVVLLPRVPHTLSKEFFFIVACVNQSGVDVLAEQLRSRLAQCKSLQDSTLSPKVSFILLNTRSKSNDIQFQEPVNKEVVDHVEDLMKTALNRKGGLYEW
jgi:PAS domain S-box-containing protein